MVMSSCITSQNQEVTVDFDKERNKKKRISGRFLRKNKKVENKVLRVLYNAYDILLDHGVQIASLNVCR